MSRLSSDAVEILLVEDNEAHAELISRAFSGEPKRFSISIAKSIKEGKQLITQNKPELIIADYRLPDGKGIDFITRQNNDIIQPVIIMTSHGDELVAVEAMKAGALDYVVKSEHSFMDFPHTVERALREWEHIKRSRLAEHALREREERFRKLFEQSNDAVLLHTQGHIIDANRMACEMLGYSKEELLHKSIPDLYSERKVPFWKTQLPWSQNSMHYLFETQWQKADGIVIDVEVSSGVCDEENGIIQWIARDVTDRKKAEEELLNYKNKIESLINASQDLIFLKDPDFKYLIVNKAHENIFSFKAEDIVGKTDFDIMPQDSAEACRFSDREAFQKGSVSKEEHIKDRVFYTSKQRVINTKGEVIGIAGVIRDISEQKKLEAKLFQAHKMEAIGTLAGGIAHDFNNILAPIMVHAELLMSRLPQDSPFQSNLAKITTASERAKDLVQQILAFSRKGDQGRRPLRLGVLAKDVLGLLRSAMPATIELNIRNLAKSDRVMANPVQIQQVLMNLCTNAAHAMRESGGKLDVTLKETYLGEDAGLHHPELEAGPYIELIVKDTGHGMDPSITKRIFDPYFTTKKKGEGTGLGLSVVRGIVASHGGAISVESVPGRGSAFYVFFPLAVGDDFTPEVADQEEEAPTGSENILLVDDEELLVDASKIMLEDLGYQVTGITSSAKALEVFQSQPQKFDLVITDMTMPGMTGVELVKEMMNIRPDIPVVLCTGYNQMIDETRAKSLGIRSFLMKPVHRLKIAQVVREVLDKQQAQTAT